MEGDQVVTAALDVDARGVKGNRGAIWAVERAGGIAQAHCMYSTVEGISEEEWDRLMKVM